MPPNSSSLKKFQTGFKETMLRPVREISQAEESLTGLFETNDIPINERLKVYHNNIAGSLSNALCATFPLIENLVGEEFLKTMARAFVFEHPPHSGCLHFYGYGFDSFIKHYEPAKDLPYLSDIAAFELAMNYAYYAEDDLPLSAEGLSQIPPEALGDAIIPLRSSSTLLYSAYPLQDIKALCEGQSTQKLDLSQKKECYLLVNRPQFDVQILPLSADEYLVLSELQDGKSLGEAVEQGLTSFPDFDFQTFLQKHISLETLSRAHTNKDV